MNPASMSSTRPAARVPAMQPLGRESASPRWFRWFLALVVVATVVVGTVQVGTRWMLARQAERELDHLAGLIEEFRAHHGTYPRVGQSSQLFDALIGRANADGQPGNYRRLIDPSRFSSSSLDPLAAGNRLLDPWGRDYSYLFLPARNGKVDSYLLFSLGPDGASSSPFRWSGPRGLDPSDMDNVYVGSAGNR